MSWKVLESVSSHLNVVSVLGQLKLTPCLGLTLLQKFDLKFQTYSCFS